jgi:hypothetical protein
MTLPRSLSAVPRAWSVRMEIMKAPRTLARQIEEEDEQQKRSSESPAVNLIDEFLAAMREVRQELRRELGQELRKELCKAGF